ncbi:insulinase family protein [Marinilabiliaceae bacterium JC017]|nr:insulinase family protein [Marinilabiliaceae bacterium JC017]
MKRISLFILLLSFVVCMQAQLDRTNPPKPGPAPKIKIGESKIFELKNGLKVFVVENHKMPVVSYSLSLDVDPVLEGEKAGYVQMTGDLMRAGTANRSKDQIDEQIDFIGASLSTSAHGIYARSLKKHSGELLDVMTDVLYHPAFPKDELEKTRMQWLTAKKGEREEPGSIAQNVAQVLIYGNEHPYGELVTEKSIENISAEDCRNYYTTYFRPNVAYLVIVGDITLKEAKKQVKKYFSSWEAAEVPAHQYEFPKSFDKPTVVVSNKDGGNQSTINVTYAFDLKPGDEDVIAARVMNQILGGGSFSARLFQNLREDKAFTYGAYSTLDDDRLAASFNASSQVRGSVTDSALTEIIYEMNRMRDELVNKEELELIKNAMTGRFSRSLEDPQTIARFALNIEKYGLPADYYQTYLEKLAAITQEDVERVAKKYLTPDHALILAVGDVSKIKASMKKLSPEGKVGVYDFYGNEVKAMPVPAGLTAEKVVESYVEAIGGKEKLTNVHDLVMKGKMNVQGMALELVSYYQCPNHQCVETFMQGNLLSKQVYNGEAGKVTGPMGEQALEGEQLESMKYESYIFPELVYSEQGFKLDLVGVEEVDGQDTYKVKIINPLGKEKVAYFSRKNGLKVKEIVQSPQGTISTSIVAYQDVDGLKFPKKISQHVGPQAFDIDFDAVQVNKGIEKEIFEI